VTLRIQLRQPDDADGEQDTIHAAASLIDVEIDAA
jgi:hypothetical protein